IWISCSNSLTILPELPVDLPLHHGCQVVQSVLAPLCCSFLSEHNFLYLVHPSRARPRTSTPVSRSMELPCLKEQQNIGLRFLLGLLPVTQARLDVSVLDSNVSTFN
ncbi:unnamed protein product, partial [Prunus brigantina]